MFINPKVFKRICKKAWKNQSLHIEHIQGEGEASWYMIRSDYWQVEVRSEFMTNVVKANLIEMIGDLPSIGECVLYGKDTDPQMEIEEIFFRNMVASTQDYTERYFPTKIYMQSTEAMLVVMQEEKKKTKILVNSVFANLIDSMAIDRDKGETPPINAMAKESGAELRWINNVMAVQCYKRAPRYKKEKVLLSFLEKEDMIYTFTDEEEI